MHLKILGVKLLLALKGAIVMFRQVENRKTGASYFENNVFVIAGYNDTEEHEVPAVVKDTQILPSGIKRKEELFLVQIQQILIRTLKNGFLSRVIVDGITKWETCITYLE